MADQIGVFKDKQHWFNFTSLKRQQEFVYYSLKIEKLPETWIGGTVE